MSAIPSKRLNAYVEIDLETLIKSVSKIVTDLSGIVLGPKQHHMVEGRLKSRMLKLGINSPQDYYSFLMNNKDSESQALLSLLTTHHTYFFREFAHFEFLESNFDELIKSIIKRGGKTLRILIAACSRGHESYSISIFLDYLLKKRNYPISYEIIAFDIDQESVAVAKNGVYDWKEIQSIPHHLLENNWKRGTGEISNFGKINDLHKKRIEFKIGNIFNLEKLNVNGNFDIIFCRNVFIYFTEDQIKTCISGFLKYLHVSGYMIFGISEAVNGRQEMIETVGPSIYRLKRQEQLPVKTLEKIKVMIVDDSPSLVVLLKKIITNDPRFDLVMTCKNGKEALSFLKSNKVDVMTLDIHMPELDGVGLLKELKYLQNNESVCFPKTIMVSSVSREDSYLVGECLNHGAMDFVEKPSLDQMLIKSDEIVTKIKSAFDIPEKEAHLSSIENSFAKKIEIKRPDKNIRLLFIKLSSIQKVLHVLKSSVSDNIKTIFVFEGAGNTIEYIKSHTNLSELSGSPDQFQIVDFQSQIGFLESLCQDKNIAIYFQNSPSHGFLNWLKSFHRNNLYISCSENLKHAEIFQKDIFKTSEIYPVTSFIYMAAKWSSLKE